MNEDAEMSRDGSYEGDEVEEGEIQKDEFRASASWKALNKDCPIDG